MRDLLLIGILLSFVLANFRVPYFMALGYLWVDFLQPQRMGYYIFNQLPVAMILGAGAFLSFIFFDKQRRFRVTVQQLLVVGIVAYATLATYNWAVVDGTGKWDWVTKALLFSAFLPMVLTTRTRIEAALAVMLFSLGAITISASAKTVLGGSGYGALRFLVSNNSGLFEGSTLATVALAMVPMLWWFYKHNSFFRPSRLTLLATIGLTISYLLVTIGAEARTGLVAMAALAVMLWWRSKRKVVSAFAIALVALAAIPFVPQTFSERMSTITEFQSDQSASTRVAVWSWTIDYVKENPLGGGFNVYRTNRLDVDLVEKTGPEGAEDTSVKTISQNARAFHSSYFEVLGELGVPGFLMWITLVVIFYVQARKLTYREKRLLRDLPEDDPRRAQAEWASSFGRAVSVFIPVYMTGSLFVGIAFQPAFYHILALTISVAALRSEQRAFNSAADPRRPNVIPRRRGGGEVAGARGI